LRKKAVNPTTRKRFTREEKDPHTVRIFKLGGEKYGPFLTESVRGGRR